MQRAGEKEDKIESESYFCISVTHKGKDSSERKINSKLNKADNAIYLHFYSLHFSFCCIMNDNRMIVGLPPLLSSDCD